MNHHFFLNILLSLLFLSACSVTPSWVIPEKEMELLLTDIHLAEAMINNDYNAFSDSVGKARLVRSIFEKHHVTKAEFDTSLVWYAANLDVYMNIYKRIPKHLSEMNDTLTARIEHLRELEAQAKRIWEKDTVCLLRTFASENQYAFSVDTSSYFSRGDMYTLHVFALGVSAKNKANVTFVWESQDTIVVDRSEIKHDGMNIFYLKSLPGKNTKSIYGNIRLPVINISGERLMLSNPFILRHREGYYPEIPVIETPPVITTQDSIMVQDSSNLNLSTTNSK
jgi:hypothetical protein